MEETTTTETPYYRTIDTGEAQHYLGTALLMRLFRDGYCVHDDDGTDYIRVEPATANLIESLEEYDLVGEVCTVCECCTLIVCECYGAHAN